MEENIEISLRLLFVGMTTVVLILSLVVLSSNILIKILNKYAKDTIKSVKKDEINPKILVALSAAVEVATGGRGKIDSIKKRP